MTQLYERELRKLDLTTAQLTLLQVLARTGPVTQGQLGRALALDSTTLSRTLRPLEAKRWILSETGQDRRERSIELTKTGRGQLERATPAWERAQQRLKAKVGAARFAALLADLSMLAAAARQA